jgi:hypothetical protein
MQTDKKFVWQTSRRWLRVRAGWQVVGCNSKVGSKERKLRGLQDGNMIGLQNRLQRARSIGGWAEKERGVVDVLAPPLFEMHR